MTPVRPREGGDAQPGHRDGSQCFFARRGPLKVRRPKPLGGDAAMCGMGAISWIGGRWGLALAWASGDRELPLHE